MCDQKLCQLVECLSVAAKQLLCLCVTFLDDLHNLLIDLRLCSITAVKHCPAVQITVLDGLQTDQAKLL